MRKYLLTISFRILTTFFLFSISNPTWAQSGTKPEHKPQAVSDSGVYRTVTNQAIPPPNWQKFLNASLLFPLEMKEDSLSVKITVEFIIEENGSLTQARAIRSEGHINGIKASAAQLKPFADESIRVVLAAPAWKAAMNQGQIVRSYFTMPIVFRTN